MSGWSRVGVRRLVVAVLGHRQRQQDVVLCSGCAQPGGVVVVVTTPAWWWWPRLGTRAWHLRCWAPRREPRPGSVVAWLGRPVTGTWADLVEQLPAAVHQELVTSPRRYPVLFWRARRMAVASAVAAAGPVGSGTAVRSGSGVAR